MQNKPPKDSKENDDLWGEFEEDNWFSDLDRPASESVASDSNLGEPKWDVLTDEGWVPDFSESVIRHKTADVLQAEEDMQQEAKNEFWISSPANQAVLMAAKKEHRLEKGKNFHGFTLEQKSLQDSEFDQFLHELKKSAAQIPSGTRIELAIVTRFIDPAYEWSADYEEGIRTCVHWTAVDLMVGERGEISSFVLDAANSFGYARMHDTLKNMFPEGRHYVYKKEELNDGNQLRVSPIQTQERGCRVFTVEHLKQLSQIDTETLYGKELPQVANENGVVHASRFSGNLKLTRIFRGMQTWTGLRALPEDMKHTVIKEKTGETLMQFAERNSVERGGIKSIKANETMAKKNRHYIEKKRHFYHSLSPENQERIIEYRQGLLFLHHPQLFKLSSILARMDARLGTQDILDFVDKLSKNLEEVEEKTGSPSEDIRYCLEELAAISPYLNAGAIKHSVLLAVADLYHHLDSVPNQAYQEGLSRVIDGLYHPKNPAVVFRSIISDKFGSNDGRSSPESSQGSSP